MRAWDPYRWMSPKQRDTAMAVPDGIPWTTISMSRIMPGNAFQAKRGRPNKVALITDPVRTGYQRAGVMSAMRSVLESSPTVSHAAA